MSDADLLRRAAALMRDRAEATREPEPDATQWYGSDGDDEDIDELTAAFDDLFDTSTARADAEHMASWSPAVAVAVAAWLDDVAQTYEGDPSNYCGGEGHGGDGACASWWCSNVDHALTVARAYLSPTGPAGQVTG